jgi:Na+/proline symporter
MDPQEIAVIPVYTVLTLLAVRWWAQVYGGSEPGGGSHVAQRMLAARDERHALVATLWFNIAHYAVRPWPWIAAGLATLVAFPDALDPEAAYVQSMGFLPTGLRGLVVAAFFAAFMSTIDTRINLAANYLVNDLYRPFIRPGMSEPHYLRVSRIVSVVSLVLGFAIFFVARDVRDILWITLAIGSGSGLVFMLRWYWWRVTAWAEVVAMTASFVLAMLFRFVVYESKAAFNEHELQILLLSTGIVTALWVLTALVTRPSDTDHLVAFYRQVRPPGPFWGHIARQVQREDGSGPADNLGACLVGWVSATVLVYAIMFGTGKLLFGEWPWALAYVAIAAVAGAALRWAMATAWPSTTPFAERRRE